MTTRTEQREAMRRKILDAALDEFLEKGYYGASTRSIGSRVGVSPGLLFHYFPTKDDLYVELVRIGLDELDDAGGEPESTPTDIVTDMATRVIDMLRKSPHVARMFTFMSYAETHPNASAEAAALFREGDVIRRTTPLMAEGQRRGEFRPGDPEALAVAFWGALQGIAESVAASPHLTLPDPDWIVDLLRERSST